MAFAGPNWANGSIDIFLQDNNERRILADYFDELDSVVNSKAFDEDEEEYYVKLRNAMNGKKFKQWGQLVRSDSGKCRVYRVSEWMFNYSCGGKLKFKKQLNREEAKKVFEDPGSGYNKVLRDFTDNGKEKYSL